MEMRKKGKRKRPRVDFRTQVVLKFGSEVLIEENSVNIGMNGLYIDSDKKIPLGSPCDVEITLFGKTSKLTMHTKGSVVRQDASGIGIQYDGDLEWWALFAIYAQYGKKRNNTL